MAKTPIRDGFHLSRTRRTLPMNLLRLRERIMSEFRPILSQHGVTEQQWRVLRVLQENEQLDASDLAEFACILAPSLSRILKALEARGLISTMRDPRDGRRTLVRLTEAGDALIRTVAPTSVATYAKLESRIGAARMQALVELLDEALTSLEDDEPPAG